MRDIRLIQRFSSESRSDLSTFRWTSHKLKYTDFQTIEFGGVGSWTAVKVAANHSVIIMLNAMIVTLEAGYQTVIVTIVHTILL